MNKRFYLLGLPLMIIALVAGCSSDSRLTLGDGITLQRVPEGGRLPQAIVDDTGAVHVVYFEGESRAGDLRYVQLSPGGSTWSEPKYVNSQAGTVVGIGPIDGGQVALGKDGRLHVVWFKLGRTEFLYTRTRDDGAGFEPQFSIAAGEGVEAGPSVAADGTGNVYVFWHTGDPPESDRSVFIAVSRDDGFTFAPSRPVSGAAEGACDCCALHSIVDNSGVLYASYRGAGENTRRGQRLLTSRDQGETFSDELIDLWEINACPISTTGLTTGHQGTQVAWETQGQVFFSPVERLDNKITPSGTADARRRNPRVATSPNGTSLLVWGDAISWQAGGLFHWQQFDASGRPTGKHGTGPEIPDGSVPAVVAKPDGTFLVIY